MNVIESNVHTCQALKIDTMTLDLLSSISPVWLIMFLDSNRTLFTFRIWLDLLGVVLAFSISNQKNFKSLQNY